MAKITWNFKSRINNILRKEKNIIHLRFYGLIIFVGRVIPPNLQQLIII